MDEVTEGWRKLRNEELQDFSFSVTDKLDIQHAWSMMTAFETVIENSKEKRSPMKPVLRGG